MLDRLDRLATEADKLTNQAALPIHEAKAMGFYLLFGPMRRWREKPASK
jgi:hypothetical protein